MRGERLGLGSCCRKVARKNDEKIAEKRGICKNVEKSD